MKITRTNPFTGKTSTREISITEDQMERYEISSELIQNIMPNISEDDREFIMTGISEDEWDKFVPNIDEAECGKQDEHELSPF